MCPRVARTAIRPTLELVSPSCVSDVELLSFERSAALAEVKADLEGARQRYGDRLRQLQLSVSEAYYRLQLADQLLPAQFRQVVVDNDQVILDQVQALKTAALVPRWICCALRRVCSRACCRLEQAQAQQPVVSAASATW